MTPESDPTKPSCGLVDSITGAICTLTDDHPRPHLDESDWRVLLEFPDPPKPIIVAR